MGECEAARITERVRRAARDGGASLVGSADVEGMAELPRAVAIATAYSPAVLRDPDDMPNQAFADELLRLKGRLAELTVRLAEMLLAEGFEACADPSPPDQTDRVRLAAPFQHKTAATRAGLGWIGKTALLVTEEYGPAVRLASVLTDAPLLVAAPIRESRCGDCLVCVEACPAGAATGEQWHVGRPREELFDAQACRKMCRQRERAAKVERGGCGICMAVCPRRPRV